jgi:A/G-specific adenine glycosylase
MAERKRALPPSNSALDDADWRRALARKLAAWYRRHRRDLPWRQTKDAYQIWVSEIMLQQTQVATVIPYFTRFVAAFPTVRDLAAAEETEVLRQWEGLGYYRRARQMHRAARMLADELQGEFPSSVEGVRRLPGVGRYTAGAIVSIAFDRAAPILEANTVRLFSRLIGYRDDVSTAAASRLLWQVAEAVLPPRRPGDFNQALMELGSLVCTPAAPECHRCPVVDLCQAYQRGQQLEIPRARAKAASEAVREAAVVVLRGDKVLVRRRAVGERWAGLWDFLRFPVSGRRGGKLTQELLDKVRQQSRLGVETPRRIATLKHGVTRFRITLDCYVCEATAGEKLGPGEWQWLDSAQLESYPLSVTGRKLARLLVDRRLLASPSASHSRLKKPAARASVQE